CARCAQPDYSSHTPNPKAKRYKAGDICSIHERIVTPIYHLLTGNPPPTRITVTSMTTWGTAALVTQGALNPDIKDKGARPCVMFDDAPIPPPKQTVRGCVCLLSSLMGERRKNALPRVLRHFYFPVYPHDWAFPGGTHIHTHPECWLLGIPFRPQGDVPGRWRDLHDGSLPDSSFHLVEEELAHFKSLCDSRATEWEIFCIGDPEFANKPLAEYEVC
ncbi:hypothetical protein C8Q77DRAFT_1065120, partial [Trametes polyzona]